MVAVQGLRESIKKAGAENLTGSLVRDTIVSMRLDTGMAPPVTMSETLPYWSGLWRIYQVREGNKILPVSDWIQPLFPMEIK